MRTALEKNKFILLTFLLAFAVLFFFYHEVLLAPNDFLFSAHGDGIKNYYTYLYHAKYDTSFHDFTGMNYPYYEHIVYTDAHPLLSWLVGKLGLVNYGIGIVNFLMLISYPIAALLIFKILKHYKLSNVWALLAAVVLAFMSPQVFRMTGHFSMSYAFAVPLMWWLLIKAYATKKWIWTYAIALYLGIFFFTHPYLGIILAFFSIVFWMVQAIADREHSIGKRILTAFLNIAQQTFLPLIVFQGYVSLTDTHADRLSDPAGFFFYYGSWKSMLMAHSGPLNSLYNKFGMRLAEWETWAYVGFSTIVFFVIICGYLIKQRKIFGFKGFLKSEIGLFLIASYLILLFAFCFPLKFDWLRWVADLFGPLKQFRILGRFTWIFFHVITVATIIGLFKIYKNTNNNAFKWVFFAGIIFYAIEFYPVHKNTAHYISLAENEFKTENIDPEMQGLIDELNKGDYDAILFLPFQHMSSENLMLLGAEQANYDAFLLSYHTQLPLVNSISSRMSLTEAITVNNYFSPTFYEKELTYDFPEDSNIALIKNRDLLKVSELRMVWESESIYENENFVLFDFDTKKWNSRQGFDKVIAAEKEATIALRNDWKSDTATTWFIYESFDTCNTELPQEQRLGGSGAYKDYKSSWNTIYQLSPDQIPPGDYVIRYWYYLRVDRPDVLAIMEEQYGEDKPAEWIAQFDVKQSTVIVADWCLVEMEFSVSPEMENINVLITGNGSKKPFLVDELMIQKQNDSPLFRRTTHAETAYLIYNNYWIKSDSFK